MPHQCLKCGQIFEEGSSQLLKGCSECGGNRFFFTKEPLGEIERNEITKQVGDDINTKLLKLMGEDKKDILNKKGSWVTVKAKDLRKAFEPHLPKKSEEIKTPKKDDIDKKEKTKEIDKIIDDKYREKKIQNIETELENIKEPETIGIEKPGKYRINIKGLLEEEPIIIQKDGTYTIHLPSIFEMVGKEKNRK